MNKSIQRYSLFITLFLFSSVPSYTNTEKRPSRRKRELTNRRKKKGIIFDKIKIPLTLFTIGGIVLVGGYAVKKTSSKPGENQQQNNNNVPKVPPINVSQSDNKPKKPSKVSQNDNNVPKVPPIKVPQNDNKPNNPLPSNIGNNNGSKIPPINVSQNDNNVPKSSSVINEPQKDNKINLQNNNQSPSIQQQNNNPFSKDEWKIIDAFIGWFENDKVANSYREAFNKGNLDFKYENTKTLLHYAAIHNLKAVVEMLISKNADINMRDDYNYTPIAYAVKYGSLDVANYLINKATELGIDLHQTHGRDEDTLLHLALLKTSKKDIGDNKKKLVEILMNKGLSIKRKNKPLNPKTIPTTPLKLMALNLSFPEISKLISNFNLKDDLGSTLLYYAIFGGKIDKAVELVKKGADISIVNNGGHTPLQLMALKLSLPHILNLISNINVKDGLNVQDKLGNTLLYYAILHSEIDLGGGKIKKAEHLVKKAEELVKKGADISIANNDGHTPLKLMALKLSLPHILNLISNINVQDKLGNTLLYYAILHSEIDLRGGKIKKAEHLVKKAEELVKNGADISIANNENQTALSLIINYPSYQEIFRILYYLYPKNPNELNNNNNKKSINDKDGCGYAPLHYIAMNNLTNTLISQFILERNPQYNIKDNDGNTPLHLAIQHGHINKNNQLLDVADLNSTNNKGETPLHLAVQLNNIKAVELLLNTKKIDTSLKTTEDKTALDIANNMTHNDIVAHIKYYNHIQSAKKKK